MEDTAKIQVSIRLYAGLRHYLPDLPLGKPTLLILPTGAAVGDVLDRLGIPREETRSCFINGRQRDHDFVLSDGDEAAFFPPVAGGES